MNATIFQSDKGDCLLIESDDGKLLLTDGGMKQSFLAHVAPALGRLRAAGREIDVAYVSHIDQDHIAGILQLMDDEAAWRVFDHQQTIGNTSVREPENPRPPKVRALWHNAFHELIGRNSGAIENLLAASSRILAAATNPVLLEISAEHQNLALSKAEAVRLSRRAGPGQLGIPLNTPAAGKLMQVRSSGQFIQLGSLRLFTIGPFAADLRTLRTEWNDWLRQNRETLRKLREQAERDERDLGNALAAFTRRMEIAAETFGDRAAVTAPNLASLMFYVEEPRAGGGKKKYLLTGDGHCNDILKGLRHHQKLDQQNGAGLHVDMLKVQHHGSEHNSDEDFCRAITADHYVFCGNGEHTNPELGVIKLVLNSRVGPAAARSPNAETGNPFTLWFNSSEAATAGANRTHMRSIKRLVTRAAATHPAVSFKFLEGDSFRLSI